MSVRQDAFDIAQRFSCKFHNLVIRSKPRLEHDVIVTCGEA